MDKKTVLIIEDDKFLSDTLKEKLNQEGYVTKHAIDGKSGYEIAVNSSPDIIMLDLFLPVVSGVTVFERLKKSFKTARIPIIILTNTTDDITANEFKLAGADAFLFKSNTSLKDIVKIIKKNLE